jgi:hypothetical protein
MLLSAGQRQTDSQRAQVLGGLGDVLGNTGQQMSQAYQAQLHGMQTEQLARDQQKLAQLDQQVRSNPAMLNNLGISPEQYGAIGPEGLIKVIQTNATKDPLDAEYKRAQIEHLKNPAGRTPTPQLVDLPGGGKGWATPGSSEITPIGGAGKGGVNPEEAKRTSAEGEALTYAKEAIASHIDLTLPNVSSALASRNQTLLNKIPTATNSWASKDFVSGDRAGTSFIDSVMRPRSGAKIDPEELQRMKEVFSPVAGDTAPFMLKKAQLRAQHIQSLIAEANPADRPALQKMFNEAQQKIAQSYGESGNNQQPQQPHAVGEVRTIGHVSIKRIN